MNPIREFYNNPYFENLKETKPFLDYLETEKKKIKETFNGGKILDIGCGNGRSTEIISNLAEEVIGIDFSRRLLEQARKKIKNKSNVKLYLEDAKSTHFENEEFDYITMFWNTFGNLYSSRNDVLNEAIRILKPKGKIFLSVFSEKVLEHYKKMLKENKLKIEQSDENYVFLREGLVSERFSKEKLKRILKDNNLVGKITPLTEITYWVEATKK